MPCACCARDVCKGNEVWPYSEAGQYVAHISVSLLLFVAAVYAYLICLQDMHLWTIFWGGQFYCRSLVVACIRIVHIHKVIVWVNDYGTLPNFQLWIEV